MYKVCISEQAANRQRMLEQAMLTLMETKRYDDITVCELCDRVDMPRKSFYRYFSSKDGALYALMDHTIMDFKHYVETSYENKVSNAGLILENFFCFWVKHRHMLDVFERSGLSGMFVERAIYSTIEEQPFVKYLCSFDDEADKKQVILFVVAGLMSMVIRWHHEGFAESAKQMAATAAQILTRPIFSEKN